MLKVPIRRYEDSRGILQVIEEAVDAPFTVARLFWLTKCKAPRGGEHINPCDYLVIAVAGAFRVSASTGKLFERAYDAEYLTADSGYGFHIGPDHAVRIDDFSEGAVCLILASAPYHA